jgi:hypothetical protein
MRLTIDGNAWNRGFWDGELALPLRSCPYDVGTTERWSWSSGYIEGNAFRNGFKATMPCSPMRPRKGAPGAEVDAVPLRVTASTSAPEETKKPGNTGVNIARRSGVKVRRRLTVRDPVKGFMTAQKRGAILTCEAFTVHDLRRSAATGMARLGIDRLVIAKCLNHRTADHATVTGLIYDRHDYAGEKRAALDRWAAHLAVLDALSVGGNTQLARPILEPA